MWISVRLQVLLSVSLLGAGCSADLDPGLASETSRPDQSEELEPNGVGAGELLETLRIPEGFDCGGGSQESSLAVVDRQTGDVRWERATPWAPGGPTVLNGDVVLVVGQTGGEPSVAAFELETGALRWQRLLAATQARLLATDGERIAVGLDNTDVIVVDAAGEVEELDIGTWYGAGYNEFGPEVWQSRYVVGPDGSVADPFDPAGPVEISAPRSASASFPSVIGDVVVLLDDHRVTLIDPGRAVEWTNASIPVDDEFSRAVDVRIGERTVLVAVGSDRGPNRRLVVLDRETGEIRWVLDGIRDADFAGDRIIYDRRTGGADAPTREVFLVADDDPTAIVWSALANDPLGGYVGVIDGRGLFVHQDPSIYPRAPYPEVGAVREVQHFRPELRVIDDDGPVDTPMAGRSDVRAPDSGVVLDDAGAAVLVNGQITVTDGDSFRVIPTDQGFLRHLLAAGGLLVGAAGTEAFGCD